MLDLLSKLLFILKFFFKGNSQIINKSKTWEISYEYQDLKNTGFIYKTFNYFEIFF